MKNQVLRHSLLLLLTAAVWGFAFVAQSVGMEYIGPFTFSAIRTTLGALVLLPFIFFRKKKNTTTVVSDHKLLLKGGFFCGVFLFGASNLQQYAIQFTSVGKTGFITAMYIVLVPILGIFLHKKIGLRIWISVAVAVIGLYVLCIGGSKMSMQGADFLLLGCALLFAFQIMCIDHFAPKVDGVQLACIQFFVCGGLSMICMFLFEDPQIGNILDAAMPILYAGILSCGVGYTFQIIGQRGLNPSIASLIMSLESVISVLAGWLLLGESLSTEELIGCALIFLAIVFVQLPTRSKKTS